MKILRYMKPYWLLAILSPIVLTGEIVAELSLPRIMANMVNIGIGRNQPEVIYQLGINMMLLVVLGGICGFTSVAVASIAAQKFSNDLRKDVFSKVIHLSFEQTDKFTTGSLITRITNDIENLRILASQSMRMFYRVGMLFFGGLILMLSISSRFGLILLVILPIEATLLFYFLRKASPLFTEVQISLDDVNSVVQESVAGARVIKAYVREEDESLRFNKVNYQLSNKILKVERILALINPALMLFMYLATILIIYFGGLSVRIPNSTLEVGDVMAALSYIGQILMSVMMFGMIFNSITRAKASGSRVLEVLNAEPVVKSGDFINSQNRSEIVFANVDFRYPGTTGSLVLKKINLTIKNGETIAILGATGSGKSSLVNLLPRFYDSIAGSILINGVNIKEYDLVSLRQMMGIVPQKTELFSGTIEDNIRWGNMDASFDEVKKACEIAQANHFIESFKDGYQTIIGEKGSSLSGGQKQRLAIARAILRNPALLIFDDSTSALDLRTEARLRQAIRENLTNTTLIIIAQRVASIKNANRIIVLDQGKIVACDNEEVLLATSPIFQDIYYSQLKNGGELNAE